MSYNSDKTVDEVPSSNGDHLEDQKEAVDASKPEFSNGFWDKDLADMRKTYLLGIAKVTFLVGVLIWGVVSM